MIIYSMHIHLHMSWHFWTGASFLSEEMPFPSLRIPLTLVLHRDANYPEAPPCSIPSLVCSTMIIRLHLQEQGSNMRGTSPSGFGQLLEGAQGTSWEMEGKRWAKHLCFWACRTFSGIQHQRCSKTSTRHTDICKLGAETWLLPSIVQA